MAIGDYLTQVEYLVFSELYAGAVDDITAIRDDFWNGAYEVVMLQRLYPEIDLLNPLWDAYITNVQQSVYPPGIIAAVTAINSHVIARGGFADLDAYLEDGDGIQVSAGWAALCVAAGYAVDVANIA